MASGSELNLNGNCGEVIIEWPFAYTGEDARSTWSIVPIVSC
jgi:hypothetical protein